MADHVVVLRSGDELSFVADACAALASAVNTIGAAGRSRQERIAVYAEMVAAYARLTRRYLVAQNQTTRVAVIDHLLVRLAEAQDGRRPVPVLDIVDRLHGELTREPALA